MLHTPESLKTYQSQLWKTKKCVDYLMERKVSLASIKLFTIGYCGDNEFSQYYDRIVFPYRTPYGECITMQGRAMYDWRAVNRPKYWHSKFEGGDKHSSLYGLYEIGELALKTNALVVVEGPFDVIACYQCGIPAVAALGTSFSYKQALLARRYTNNLYFWYDTDDAGRRGLENALGVVKDLDFDAYVVEPDTNEKDASDIYCAHGRHKIKELVKNARQH